jgi:hypothetical protein
VGLIARVRILLFLGLEKPTTSSVLPARWRRLNRRPRTSFNMLQIMSHGAAGSLGNHGETKGNSRNMNATCCGLNIHLSV